MRIAAAADFVVTQPAEWVWLHARARPLERGFGWSISPRYPLPFPGGYGRRSTAARRLQFPAFDGALCEEAGLGLPEWGGRARWSGQSGGCAPVVSHRWFVAAAALSCRQGSIETKRHQSSQRCQTGCSEEAAPRQGHIYCWLKASDAVVPTALVGHRHT